MPARGDPDRVAIGQGWPTNYHSALLLNASCYVSEAVQSTRRPIVELGESVEQTSGELGIAYR